jgi:molybdenum-dependent DNA-binding transcriptional regulator ModE
MNKTFDEQLVTMSIGGKSGGGAALVGTKVDGAGAKHLLDISRHALKHKRHTAMTKNARRSLSTH